MAKHGPLNWLFSGRGHIPAVFPAAGVGVGAAVISLLFQQRRRARGGRVVRPARGAPKQPASIPLVYPISPSSHGGPPSVVFGPNVNVSTYHPEAVVYGEGELFNIPEHPEIPLNQWIRADSSAIKSYMFQTYLGQRGIGSIWIQFVGGKKKYNYPNVPWREFVNLHNAPSQGRFVNHVLRPLYSVGQGRNWRMRAGRRYVRRTRK